MLFCRQVKFKETSKVPFPDWDVAITNGNGSFKIYDIERRETNLEIINIPFPDGDDPVVYRF